MTARQQQGGPTIIAWSLILLALISRIAFGGLASPDNVLHSQGEQQSLLSILCEGDLPPDDGHHAHHLPATDMATLLAEAHGLDAPPDAGDCTSGPRHAGTAVGGVDIPTSARPATCTLFPTMPARPPSPELNRLPYCPAIVRAHPIHISGLFNHVLCIQCGVASCARRGLHGGIRGLHRDFTRPCR
ncbi:hypothetical protein [Novacetimonas sp. GS1]|uniref:hypothetical protein n=1 Tax=Novacetimonas sp. GS1 TaxID=3119990 RepID=UPI002FCD038B